MYTCPPLRYLRITYLLLHGWLLIRRSFLLSVSCQKVSLNCLSENTRSSLNGAHLLHRLARPPVHCSSSLFEIAQAYSYGTLLIIILGARGFSFQELFFSFFFLSQVYPLHRIWDNLCTRLWSLFSRGNTTTSTSLRTISRRHIIQAMHHTYNTGVLAAQLPVPYTYLLWL